MATLDELFQIHDWYAVECLTSLNDMLTCFDSVHARAPGDGLSEDQWKGISYLQHLSHKWPRELATAPEFAIVQSGPVELCGLIESSAHYLLWRLCRIVSRASCEAIEKGSTFLCELPRFSEEQLSNADWRKLHDAVYLDHDGHAVLGYRELNRLEALLEQEYHRAVQLVQQRTADSKTDNEKKSAAVVPENPQVARLAKEMKRRLPQGDTKKQIALDFADGDAKTAASLLRQLRRFPHLLD